MLERETLPIPGERGLLELQTMPSFPFIVALCHPLVTRSLTDTKESGFFSSASRNVSLEILSLNLSLLTDAVLLLQEITLLLTR